MEVGKLCRPAATLAVAPGARDRRLGLLPWVRRKDNLPLTIGILVVGSFALAAILAPVLTPYGPDDMAILLRLKPPIWLAGGVPGHPLGTDELGRDMLTRLIHGSRISLLVGVLAVAISGPVGVVIGLVAGHCGRKVDAILMRITEMQLAIPTVLFAIAIVAVLGPGVRNVILTLALTGWPVYARIVRGETLTVREREYALAARVLGASQRRVIAHHILPNVTSSAIVIATFSVANMILLEATLSFLGLGVEPSVVTWGSMLNNGRTYMQTAWWLTAFPGLMIFLTVLGVNLIGDHLRDVLDPTLRHRGVAGSATLPTCPAS